MKTAKRITAIFFMLGAIAYGQEEKAVVKMKPFFGLKAGLNAHPVKNRDSGSTYSFGYQLGTTLNVPISPKFSFQPELLFQYIGSRYGYSNSYSNGSVTDESKTKSHYLTLPLNFKYAISKKVGIELGPSINYLVSGTEKVTVTSNLSGVTTVDEFNYKVSEGSDRLSFAANLGTEYYLNDQLYTGLRYTLFISQYQSADDTLSNSVFALSLGYNFN